MKCYKQKKLTIEIPGCKPSREIREEWKKKTVMLAFSCGKDSVAAWLALREAEIEVIPFYCQTIPGMSFIDRALEYYEGFFGKHIIRVQHPRLYRMLNNFVFQPPERCWTIEACRLPEFTYEEIVGWMREDFAKPNTWLATGVRCADSILRRMHFKRHGSIVESTNTIYPVWDLTREAMRELLGRHKVRLPADYDLFGKSFDGLDFRFVNQIQKHYPADYAKIQEWFPLIDLELKRYEYGQKNS